MAPEKWQLRLTSTLHHTQKSWNFADPTYFYYCEKDHNQKPLAEERIYLPYIPASIEKTIQQLTEISL